jgi:copper chaperone CopZ
MKQKIRLPVYEKYLYLHIFETDKKTTLRSNTLRKTLTSSMLAIAAVALMAVAGYACGEKAAKAERASSQTKASLAGSEEKPCAVRARYTCDAVDKTSGTAAATDGEWSTRTISVRGMTCTSCEKSISAALAEVPGVVEVVKVCHKSAEAVVRVDAEKVKDAELTVAITNKGYQAEVIPAVAKTTDLKPKGSVCPLSDGPGCDKPADKVSAETTLEGAH